MISHNGQNQTAPTNQIAVANHQTTVTTVEIKGASTVTSVISQAIHVATSAIFPASSGFLLIRSATFSITGAIFSTNHCKTGIKAPPIVSPTSHKVFFNCAMRP
jgi:hypothetical protein